MKQDLHRAIQAHNHNSDLMRHHRDAIEDVRQKLRPQSRTKEELRSVSGKRGHSQKAQEETRQHLKH